MILYIKPVETGFEVNLKKKGVSVEITLCTEKELKNAQQMVGLYKAFFECKSVLD